MMNLLDKKERFGSGGGRKIGNKGLIILMLILFLLLLWILSPQNERSSPISTFHLCLPSLFSPFGIFQPYQTMPPKMEPHPPLWAWFQTSWSMLPTPKPPKKGIWTIIITFILQTHKSIELGWVPKLGNTLIRWTRIIICGDGWCCLLLQVVQPMNIWGTEPSIDIVKYHNNILLLSYFHQHRYNLLYP